MYKRQGQNGPGATNLVTGLAQAKAAFSPVVSLAGLYSTKDKMEDAFQGLDQQSLFEPVTKKTITLKNSKNIPNAISDGFNVAMSPRRGPVCINLPRNLLAEKNNYKINEKIKSFKNTNNTQSKPDTIKRAAKLISNSSKGIIIVGGGIKYTSGFKPVIELAEYLNVPIVTAAGHGDAIPFNHKLNAGQMGPRGNPVATKLTKEADVIIAIGTRLGFNSTFLSYEYLNKKAKIIQIELEKKMLGRYFPIQIGINADAETSANQILNEYLDYRLKLKIDIEEDISITNDNEIEEKINSYQKIIWSFFNKVKIIYLEHLNEALVIWNDEEEKSIFISSEKPSSNEIN